MSEAIAREGLESLGRFYGIYRGFVSEDVDPEQRGRIGVTVPGVCPRTVWANPRNQDGALGSGFKWLNPKKGQVVWVEYMYGDPLNPVWSYHGWALRECPEELSDNSSFGFVTPLGNKLIIQEDSAKLHLQIIDPDSLEECISITSEKGITEVSSSKEIKVTSDKIILNAQDEGLPLSSKLIEKINELQQEINQLKLAFGPSGLAAAMAVMFPTAAKLTEWSISPPVNLTNQSEIENQKVLQ